MLGWPRGLAPCVGKPQDRTGFRDASADPLRRYHTGSACSCGDPADRHPRRGPGVPRRVAAQGALTMADASPAEGGGLPGPIGERFGAFEPRFYGVSFLIETPAMFQAWASLSGISGGESPPKLPPFEDTCLQTALDHELRH